MHATDEAESISMLPQNCITGESSFSPLIFFFANTNVQYFITAALFFHPGWDEIKNHLHYLDGHKEIVSLSPCMQGA